MRNVAWNGWKKSGQSKYRGGAEVLDFGYYNMDCMDGMREFPDKFFDIAVVDPPYLIAVLLQIKILEDKNDRKAD